MVRNTEMGTLKLACGRGPWRKRGGSLVTVEGRRKDCLTLGGQDSCDSKSRCGWGLTGWWARVGIGGRHFWSLHLGGGRKMVRSTPSLATRGDLSETGVCMCLILADVVFCGDRKYLKQFFIILVPDLAFAQICIYLSSMCSMTKLALPIFKTCNLSPPLKIT